MRRRHLAPLALLAAAGMAVTLAPVPGSDLLVPAAEVADGALVADAGSSTLVGAGQKAVLLGTAFAGDGNYTYEWSVSAGTLADPTNPTAVVDTSDGAGVPRTSAPSAGRLRHRRTRPAPSVAS